MDRLISLDGLRGVASLVVVFTHIMLTSELFAGVALRGESGPPPYSLQWMITYSPLHLFWDGTAAVAIFFVLSGLVLTLPVLRAGVRGFSWRVYYPKRLLRLYLPVWVAVLFGTVLATVVPRVADGSLGSWLSSRPDPSMVGILKDLALIGGPSDVISPLWTLQWEVLFSLLLPAYIAFVVVLPKWWIAKLLAVICIVGIGAVTGTESVVYMATFAIGCLFAKALRRIAAFVAVLRTWTWVALAAAIATMMSLRWIVLAFDGSEFLLSLARIFVIIGAAGAVLLAAFWPRAVRLLQSPVVTALGLISFSLYLVHEPIVLAICYLFGSQFSWFAAPVSIAAAFAFYKLVERPSHRLSVAVGKTVSRRITVRGITADRTT
ncbi:peptidoglycan/LPS O-acetylase OafA/YrhL [Glaciihabitans tibetensis]|uniref:Peptidoglycan/LPS O-acetylase OafA/YrhL n=1 Tax=Glaciihabitans tibetensis TaxID=1266600 RepID=A0A2T0V395_9MICO|nr:acyltransferase [Glaciihabitans tibetensis]PRY64642.1 peptidoglycan/LPS O-acetylase OafA/YrhL [Glaciihabitans tibetensis]